MYQGEVIFDFYPETVEADKLLNQLKGNDKLLFAIRKYEKEDIEGALRYTIDDAIVATSESDITQKFFGFSNSFMWFEPRNDEEIGVCIENQIASYFGCVLEDGQQLGDAKYAFEYFELLTIKDDCESALYICSEEKVRVNEFLMKLDDYTCVEVKEDSLVWLSNESEYLDIWGIKK
jgi:hypothetical protein